MAEPVCVEVTDEMVQRAAKAMRCPSWRIDKARENELRVALEVALRFASPHVPAVEVMAEPVDEWVLTQAEARQAAEDVARRVLGVSFDEAVRQMDSGEIPDGTIAHAQIGMWHRLIEERR